MITRNALVLCIVVISVEAVAAPQDSGKTSKSAIEVQREIRFNGTVPNDVEVVPYLFDANYLDCTESCSVSVDPEPNSKDVFRLSARITNKELYYAVIVFKEKNKQRLIAPPLNHWIFGGKESDSHSQLVVCDQLEDGEFMESKAIAANASYYSHSSNISTLVEALDNGPDRVIEMNKKEAGIANKKLAKTIATIDYAGVYATNDGKKVTIGLSDIPFFLFDDVSDTDVTHVATLGDRQVAESYKGKPFAVTGLNGTSKIKVVPENPYTIVTNSLLSQFSPISERFSVSRSGALRLRSASLAQMPVNHRNAVLEQVSTRIGRVIYPDGNQYPDDSQKIQKIDGGTNEQRLKQWKRLQKFHTELDQLRLGMVQPGPVDSISPPIDLLFPLYTSIPTPDWVQLANLAKVDKYSNTAFWAIVNPNSGPTSD